MDAHAFPPTGFNSCSVGSVGITSSGSGGINISVSCENGAALPMLFQDQDSECVLAEREVI